MIHDRQLGMVKRIADTRRDLKDLKTRQLIGRDVVRPQIVQRYVSPGVPTHHDIEGVFEDFGGFQGWSAGGTIEFIPDHQSQGFADWYVEYFVDPDLNPPPPPPDVNSFEFTVEILPEFLREDRIVYDFIASSLNIEEPTIDRMWMKLLFYATDTGTFDINLDFGTVVTA